MVNIGTKFQNFGVKPLSPLRIQSGGWGVGAIVDFYNFFHKQAKPTKLGDFS